ncbi:MAG TPA: DUF1553 domain-containing protein, partial [Myxococcota bacterium]|nr:DUF1553 domain-containing protein [Myxococcota bacterium]
LARQGIATQSTTAYEGAAKRAIDGNTDGQYEKAQSTTHTEISTDPWWEVDLQKPQAVERITLWNRTDGASERLKGFKILLLDERRSLVWQQTVNEVPSPSATFRPSGNREIPLDFASASYAQKEFPALSVVENRDVANRGWAVAPRFGEPHELRVLPSSPALIGAGSNLVVRLEHASKYEQATVSRFRISFSTEPRSGELVRTPPQIVKILRLPPESRSPAQQQELQSYYLSVAPGLKAERERLAALRTELDGIKPYTTVPVLRELAGEQKRKTRLQRRGNFMELGDEVSEGLPAAFQTEVPKGEAGRLALAKWLVSAENPLTARVAVNRLWEAIFGIGLVRTSEEFGAQGELPSHPELLDWLAVEYLDRGWDTKAMLRLLVTSASYRQSSKV